MDFMEDLHFVDSAYMQNNFNAIDALLTRHKINLIIDLEKDSGTEVRANLLVVCCAILNLKINKHIPNVKVLDDQILRGNLNTVNLNHSLPNEILIKQLACIKNLINRTGFNLTEGQIRQIHQKFKSMNISRKNRLYFDNKQNKIEKVL